MKLKVTLVESAPGRSGRENDELPLVIMVPVLDARTTIRALARRVEADIAETFGTDGDARQRCAIPERGLVNTMDTLGKNNGFQTTTTFECFAGNAAQSLR